MRNNHLKTNFHKLLVALLEESRVRKKGKDMRDAIEEVCNRRHVPGKEVGKDLKENPQKKKYHHRNGDIIITQFVILDCKALYLTRNPPNVWESKPLMR